MATEMQSRVMNSREGGWKVRAGRSTSHPLAVEVPVPDPTERGAAVASFYFFFFAWSHWNHPFGSFYCNRYCRKLCKTSRKNKEKHCLAPVLLPSSLSTQGAGRTGISRAASLANRSSQVLVGEGWLNEHRPVSPPLDGGKALWPTHKKKIQMVSHPFLSNYLTLAIYHSSTKTILMRALLPRLGDLDAAGRLVRVGPMAALGSDAHV
jgi:hypothetical protein